MKQILAAILLATFMGGALASTPSNETDCDEIAYAHGLLWFYSDEDYYDRAMSHKVAVENAELRKENLPFERWPYGVED